MKAERITDVVSYHGEGPVWWPALGALRCVDMLAGTVLTLREDGTVERTPVGSRVVAVLRPRVGGGAIMAREHDIAIADRDDLSDVRPVAHVLDDPGIRFNEGGCDPDGRFYAGTMAYRKTEGAAKLYVLDATSRGPAVVLQNLTVSNGLGWSPDGRTAYFNDSPTGAVASFDYGPEGLNLGTRRDFVRIAEDDGHPDGLCVDAEGGIWVALHSGSAVRRYDPMGRLSEVVELAVTQVTACTFGGPDLDTLYVTTSRENLADGTQPEAGSLFAVKPGVRGMPPLAYRG